MKFSAKATLTAVALSALLWAAPAQAQSHYARFDVPFPFVAGNQVLPAGTYHTTIDEYARMTFRSTNETATHVVVLSRKDQPKHAGPVTDATLRFTKFGEQMFLTAAWAAGHEDGQIVPVSSEQLEAMKHSGGAAPVAVTVTELK